MLSAQRNIGSGRRATTSNQRLAAAVVLTCAGLVVSAASRSQAAIDFPIASGAWEDPNIWVAGSPPGATDDAYLDSGVVISSTGSNTFGGELQVGLEANAYGRGNPGGPATLNIDAGVMTVGTPDSGKSIVVGQSQAVASDNSGVLNIAAGATLQQNSGYVLIGFFGPLDTVTTGVVNVNGGTFNSLGTGEFRIGGRDGNYNTGTLNINSGGTVNVTKGVFLGGASNAGLNISGTGSSFSTNQFISIGTEGANPNAVVNLTISDGTINCRELSINEGKAGTNTLTQTGGLIHMELTTGNANFQIGRSTNGPTALGVYNMSGGTLEVLKGDIEVASGNAGSWTISGTSQVTVGAGKSILLNSNNRSGSSAVVTQSGGNVSLPADSASGIRFSELGTTTYNLNGGTLTTPMITSTPGAGTRTMGFNGGTLVANGNIVAGDLITTLGASGGSINTNGNSVTWNAGISGAGAMNKFGAGTLQLTAANTYTGGTSVGGGTVLASHPDALGHGSLAISSGSNVNFSAVTSQALLVTSLSVSSGGTLDLLQHDMVIDYTGSSPLSQMPALLSSGKLVSTGGPASERLGYSEAPAGGTTFSGRTVDDSSVLVKYTFAGDTNLDGKVDIVDLGKLAGKWQQSGMWTDGDVNYDGTVNIVDLGLLAGNWQAGVGAGSTSAPELSQALAALGLPNVSVPEPACVTTAILGIGSLMLKRRGRSSRAQI